MNKPNIEELLKMINRGEDELKKLEDAHIRKHKRKRITRALEGAYEMLNKSEYTQKEVDDNTHKIWLALQDAMLIFWWWLLGILLIGALIFSAYETYSFIQNNKGPVNPYTPPEINEVVTVNYTETDIVSLYDMIPLSDNDGLRNPAQTFTISNDSSKLKSDMDYKVDYTVNIIELNQGVTNILDKKFIKYQLTYTDESGREVVSDIKRLSDLEANPDGSLILMKGKQNRDTVSNFKMIVWLASDATDSEQNKSYTFKFHITANIVSEDLTNK